jgi:ribosomal protein S18 acetylase RimI-like enzyme
MEQRVYPFPWSRGNFADSLAAGHGAWLAQEQGRMTAYAVTMQVLDEIHLLNLTVPPELQRRGRGTAMLAHLLELARNAAGEAHAARSAAGKSSRAGAVPADTVSSKSDAGATTTRRTAGARMPS